MQHGTLSGYTHGGCRGECCLSVMRTYKRRRQLELRIFRLADQYDEAVAALEAFDNGQGDDGQGPGTVPPLRPVPAPQPVAGAGQPAPAVAVPLTIGALGQWRCGHTGSIGLAAMSKPRAELACPRCGQKGLVAQLIGGQWAGFAGVPAQ